MQVLAPRGVRVLFSRVAFAASASALLAGLLSTVGVAQANGPRAVPSGVTPSEPTAGAQQGGPYRATRLVWRQSWGHVGTRDYLLFGAGVSVAVGKLVVGPSFGLRRGGMLFDEDVRQALRLETLQGERLARDVSDVLLTSTVSYPFFDSIVIAGWYRASPEVAREMAWINAEAMAVTAGLQGLTNIIAGRERPYGRRCGKGKPADGRDCDSSDRFYSFFSGHASQAFTAAGLVCIHHAYLPLYGGGLPDAGICAIGMLSAAATATLRVVGDQHYFTDVAVGAVVGTLSGVGLPWLLFYRHDNLGDRDDDVASLEFQVVPTPNGITLLGTF